VYIFFLLFLGEKLNRWKDYIDVVVNSINNAKKSDIKSNLKYLTNLTEINLDYNLFCEIPEELYFLDQISSISLSNNSISRIDENIRKFSNLEYLDLSGNPLCGELPESISTLKKLRSFYLKQPDENENNSTKIYKECGYSNYNQKCFFTSEQKLKMEKLLPLCNITF